jgi:hypothetical protein
MIFSAVVSLCGWSFANVVYYRMKRDGERGFGRFAAFWVGTPTTWITLFVVGRRPRPSFDHEDDESLLAEVRRDRALREGGSVASVPASEEPMPPDPESR